MHGIGDDRILYYILQVRVFVGEKKQTRKRNISPPDSIILTQR